MQECYEIEDLKKFKKDKKFLDNLEKGINSNIQTKTNNIGLSHIYRNIIHGRENINKRWDYLQGVHNCYMYTSEKYNMNILIIGENHNASSKYEKLKSHIDVKQFIETQISTATDYVDLFVEYTMQNRNMSNIQFGITKFFWPENNMVDTAITYFKSTTDFAKPYQYLRTHLIDIRSTDTNVLFYVVLEGFEPSSTYANTRKMDLAMDILKTTKSRVNFFLKIVDDLKISKQLENIKDKELADIIYNYFMNMISDDFLSRDLKSSEPTRFIKSEIIKSNLNDKGIFTVFLNRLLFYCTVIMDMYTISRLFRTYNVKDPNVYSGRARNAILFTGSSHSTNYSNFLKHLKHFTEKYNHGHEIVDNIDGQMHTKVNISKLEQPVFINKNRIL